MVVSKVVTLFSSYFDLERKGLLFNEWGFISITRKTATGNYYQTMSAIQRSDPKLWPF